MKKKLLWVTAAVLLVLLTIFLWPETPRPVEPPYTLSPLCAADMDVLLGGDGAALETFLESKGFSAYMKTAEGVKVTLAKEGENALVPIGRAGVNSEFTAMLGLETFLGWFILQM